ncbi:DUF1194 domain-containing protein [Sulfitobacter mediterraneus]|uniref:DUF1194 domain-containing protein n=1 Tax=Sulfitobacter mediterraneus TaxID=83219 RepID=UPI0019341C68|nr:DUF1194 domain-containing protein [Sulfitobacter mediterraneus]MBM1311443.1 DUF1194 domain-containing protein [Sulfitobacter mediterraneus]MBM1315325.1 DUF1194 domain-containing protein [Sulfitobacter mediterraneus]MBM1323686.1 DUF1194 domain-containing protein [Sulfitobacter mediterraneus]MBM1327598.1 DUF1194 domain-containing protein [Sulfitobacter mediterraneus]MBM1398946.1 DUF1194 domain-containing protein [Sulfitobacter mediterraneus]
MRVLLTLLALLARPALACELALVLAVDVSGSVDRAEYRIQMDGLAAALSDGIVTEALVEQQARVTLIQWSGTSRQEQTIPWTVITEFSDVAALAEQVADAPRRWRNYSTAIGEALTLSAQVLETATECRRKVVDVSGDGKSNEGIAPADVLPQMRARGIIVNALAIETDDTDLTAYFFENLISGEGAFVITANGFEDYPAQIRRKLQRETTKQLSLALPFE